MTTSWTSWWTQSLGAGPPVLWLHGLGESSLCFAALVRHPQLQRVRHQLLDLPGYGRSPWPTQPYGLAELTDEVVGLLAHGREPAVVIGHSMGGVLAQLVAERAPALVRALVNVEGNLSLGDCNFSGRAAACELAPFLEQGFSELCDGVYSGGATSASLRGYYASLRFADPRVFHRHSRDLLAYSSPEDLAARAAALPMPALYIAGAPDGVCEHSRALLVRAGARWRDVAPAGHVPFIDRPDDFAAVLAEFLHALPEATRSDAAPRVPGKRPC